MTVPCALVLSIMLGPLYVHFVHYEAVFLPALGGSSYQDMAMWSTLRSLSSDPCTSLSILFTEAHCPLCTLPGYYPYYPYDPYYQYYQYYPCYPYYPYYPSTLRSLSFDPYTSLVTEAHWYIEDTHWWHCWTAMHIVQNWCQKIVHIADRVKKSCIHSTATWVSITSQ